ncbi:DUF1353 domain-containing protein [Phytohalomonas tamaricis]|uniref:DUF1353 domain-containing protein n=1 Tax=Phytohalomonas tamaricis TaxID=2081032 RepID=UPI000D0ACDE0|nr:DUF1353 domain-containing protein [Phytohalomonas tamaricis]
MASEPIPVDILLPDSWRQPAQYRLKNGMSLVGVDVPAGFITDGASVPRMFWWLFPSVDRYFDAAAVHDYLLSQDTEWSKAADAFNEALKETAVPGWRRVVMVTSVRLWGLFQ